MRREGRAALEAADRARALRGLRVAHGVGRGRGLGVDSDARLFEFWNWVGGRYSSTSSAGVLPLAPRAVDGGARAFLDGARAMDEHFFAEPLETNVPVVMAPWASGT